MATIALLCADEDDRSRLSLIVGESGHNAYASGRLAEFLEILREHRPRLLLIAEGAGLDAEVAIRELARASPLLPIVVVLKTRDANRAVQLMRAGAAEVAAPPWTRESLNPCVAKALRFQGTALSVVRLAPTRRGTHVYALCALAFFCLAFGWASVRRQERLRAAAIVSKTFWDLPYAHCAGIAHDGKNLWIVDWFTQSFYVHSPADLAIRRVVHFTAETPVAIAFAADAVWSVTAGGTITRRMNDAALSPLQIYPKAAPYAAGLAFDGLYLWTCDAHAKRLRKHLIDQELTVVASYPYPGTQPVGLVFDGRTLWSLDAANHELIRHNLERPDEAITRVTLPEYRDGIYRPVGLAWDGERFWTVAEKKVQAGSFARLFRHAGIP